MMEDDFNKEKRRSSFQTVTTHFVPEIDFAYSDKPKNII